MISEINYKKLENIENLVQQLKKLTSTDDEPLTTDHTASLCNTKNMDHQYVSEILLASDILVKDLRCGLTCSMPIQLHPSGHSINPDLFFVLEQTKSAWFTKPEPVNESILWPKPDTEKLHRKLIFDVVNEILIHKMELLIPNSCCNLLLETRKLSCQHLLKELCSEVDRLQAERLKVSSFDDGNLISCKNLLCQSEGWTNFGSELPGLVSEIERLIFKGLVDEVLTGEAAFHLQKKPSRWRKQLSTKCRN